MKIECTVEEIKALIERQVTINVEAYGNVKEKSIREIQDRLISNALGK